MIDYSTDAFPHYYDSGPRYIDSNVVPLLRYCIHHHTVEIYQAKSPYFDGDGQLVASIPRHKMLEVAKEMEEIYEAWKDIIVDD